MRTPLVAANWKMFKTVGETVKYVKEFRALVKDLAGIDIVVAPPFTAVHAAAEAARNSTVEIAGQDLHWEREGAFTGEVSAAMLREAGAEWVIVGHSERRTLFGETDASVNARVKAALEAELTPIVCIGETLEHRERGATFAVLDMQLARGLEGIAPDRVAQLAIAYEPVWAIGTGRNATPEQAEEAHAHIRAQLERHAGSEAAGRCRVIYGGSVKVDNVESLVTQPNVDGALVGGASLDLQAFFQIVSRTLAARSSGPSGPPVSP
jgi:triosephosphate isomerase